MSIVGVGAGALGNDDIKQLQAPVESSGRAYPNDAFHVEHVIQLIGIDADGGHPHAAGHNGDPLALVITRIALNAPDIVHQLGIGQIGLGNHFGPQGISGHEYGLGKIFRRAADVRGKSRHRSSNNSR